MSSSHTQSICTGFDSPVGMTRRRFLNDFGLGLGGLALAGMAQGEAQAAKSREEGRHTPARAKRVIYLFQSGGPAQMDLMDYKPLLNQQHGVELPDHVRRGQRLTAMSGNQASLPIAGSPFKFAQHGESGTWMSDALPHTSKIVDDICVVQSLHTDAINHGPGVTFMQTGSQFPGRPSMGAWLDYGLGSSNHNLPSFVVMVTKNKGGQPLVSRLWGSAFLPTRHQGVRFRSGDNPVLYLANPNGVDRSTRRKMLDRLAELHELEYSKNADPQIESRIEQYELAYRMQASVPEATDINQEPDWIFDEYGKDARNPGSFAANCLQARRLAERGVRFIQLYHPGWDQHGSLKNGLSNQCRETDQASAALVRDLKRRGMLDDTLVIWGGEFGRTNYCQGKLNANFGRDHHGRCFSSWMAGGGIQPGTTYGQTDDFGYNVVENPMSIHDFHATLLHLLGVDHERLTHKHQGRRYRLTDVHGKVHHKLLA